MPAHGGRIVDLAVQLRAFAPETWEQFTLAVRDYAAAVTADMVRCPTESLPRAQGMAVAANEIASLLQNAPKLKDNQLHAQRKPSNGQPAASGY